MLSEEDKKDFELIEKHFHELICETYHTKEPDFPLRPLDEEAMKEIAEGKERSQEYFASAPGGGFSYTLHRGEDGKVFMRTQYSNRFCWGSEVTYRITPSGYEDLHIPPTDVPVLVSEDSEKKQGHCIIC